MHRRPIISSKFLATTTITSCPLLIQSSRHCSSSSSSWLDINNNLPSAIASREVDTLLTRAFAKLDAQTSVDTQERVVHKSSANSSTSTTFPLTLETAVGLLQASRFADIELRSTEKYERHHLNKNTSSKYDSSSSSASASLQIPSLIQHSIPLFLSGGLTPLSLRRPISDGTATTRLLSEFLIHPNFINSSPSHQAILVDAAGQTLDRLASTVCADAVEEFCLCAASALEQLTMRSVDATISSGTKGDDNKDSSTAASNNFIEIHQAEKQMIREAWRRFQRSICKVNPLALTASVLSELEIHLSLAKKCNLENKIIVNSNTGVQQEDQNQFSSNSISKTIQETDVALTKKYKRMIKQISVSLSEMHNNSNNNTSSSSSSPDNNSNNDENNNDNYQSLSQEDALATASSQLLEETSLFDFVCAVDAMNLVSSACLRKLPSEPNDNLNGSYMSQQNSSNNSSSSISAFEGVVESALHQMIVLAKGITNICPLGDDWNSLRDTTIIVELVARHLCDVVSGETKNGDEVFVSSSIDTSSFDPLRGYHLLKLLHKCHTASLLLSSSTSRTLTEEENNGTNLRIELQQLVKNLFPRGTAQQHQASSNSSTLLPAFLQSNTTNNVAGIIGNNNNSNVDDSGLILDNNNSEHHQGNSINNTNNMIIGTTSSDYHLLQHAHVALISLLTTSSNDDNINNTKNDDGDDVALISAAEQCYSLISSHKYYGVKVTSKMMLPMLKVLSPIGDSRVFNAIDVCTLFSGCSVTDEVLCEAFKTCAAAGDHHRARQLVQLLKNDIPGLISKIPKDGLDALVELGVVPPLAGNYFESSSSSGEKKNVVVEDGNNQNINNNGDCLTLSLTSSLANVGKK